MRVEGEIELQEIPRAWPGWLGGSLYHLTVRDHWRRIKHSWRREELGDEEFRFRTSWTWAIWDIQMEMFSGLLYYSSKRHEVGRVICFLQSTFSSHVWGWNNTDTRYQNLLFFPCRHYFCRNVLWNKFCSWLDCGLFCLPPYGGRGPHAKNLEVIWELSCIIIFYMCISQLSLGVLVSCGWHNKVPQTRWLKT